MPPTLNEVLDALPLDDTDEGAGGEELHQIIARLAHRPVPVGRLPRLWAIGTLQGRIAAAYLAWWLRSFGADADQKQRDLNETHLRAAIRVLGSMGYLRGALTKVGQLLASYPDIVPAQFAEVLNRLHFEAPPMHFSLLREFARRELGRDPEDVFDDFETNAFAAASLGQVHRARLKDSGERVAVKIQYPDIARTIGSDLANFRAAVFPLRLGGDWDSMKAQFDEIRRMLELECDYEHEAANQRQARLAFRESDGIFVPRVHDRWSTRHVLTMDYVPGVHVHDFMATSPPEAQRNAFAEKVVLAIMRLSYGSLALYADPHPGNFIFMPDGRLGLIDFGCCHHYSDEDARLMTQAEHAIYGSREARREAIIAFADMTPRQQRDERRMKLLETWGDWLYEPIWHDGPFDFGSEDYMRRGIDLYTQIVRHRYVRALPVNIWLARNFFGVRAMLYRLRATIDFDAIMRRESTVERGSVGDSPVSG